VCKFAHGGITIIGSLLKDFFEHLSNFRRQIGVDIHNIWRKFGNVEVGDIGVVVFVEEDIAGLEVAVDDAFAVGIIQRVGETQEDVGDLIQLEAVKLNTLSEGAALRVAHNIEHLIVIEANIMHRHDGGMFELGNDLGFAFEAQA